jgi:hypothetical protein
MSFSTSSRVLFGLGLLLALLGGGVLAAPRAGAVVGGYVEVHVLACPPGYAGDNPFRDCHANRLGGVAIVADGPGPRHYQDVTGEDGRVILGDFLQGGEVTISLAQPSGDYASYQVYCSRVDTQAPIKVEQRGDGRAAALFTLPDYIVAAGSGVVCDWYNIPAAPPQGAGSIEIHESACPPGVSSGDLFGLCHAYGRAGVGLILIGPNGPTGTATTAGPIGAALFPDLSAGQYRVAESTLTGDFIDYKVVCTSAGAPVSSQTSHDGGASVTFQLPAGAHVVCDWFNIAAAAIVPTVGPGHEAPDGGLGLSRVDWEQIHGKGTANGATFTYENGAYDVAFTDGVVTFIEIGWESQGGVSAADANAAVAKLIPVDAIVTGTATLPATAAGPIALTVQRLRSDTLAVWLEGGATGSDGGIVIVSQVQAPRGAAEPKIMRVSIVIERAAS